VTNETDLASDLSAGGSINEYQQSLKIDQAAGNLAGESISLNNLGLEYNDRGQWAEAIDCHQQDLIICRNLHDREGESAAFNNLGLVYYNQGKLDESIDCHQQSLAICQELGDREGEGASFNNLGMAYRSQCRWDESIECYQQSLIIERELNDPQRCWEGQILDDLAKLYQAKGQLDLAIPLWQEALTKLPNDAREYPIIQSRLAQFRS
jgi:tetratricopeptide (TPR) repeat protein